MKKTFHFFAKVAFFSFVCLVIIPAFIPTLFSDALAQASISGSTITANSNSQNNNQLVSVMCNALKIVTGNGGKAFAAFAIISVGIGFFTGKVSWGLMIGVAMGIAAMFGAPTIVAAISGKNSFDCSDGT